MKKNKQGRSSFKEAASYNARVFLLWWRVNPKAFVSTGLSILVSAGAPYLSIYFTAGLIDEIAGDRDMRRLILLTGAVLLTASLSALLGAALGHWKKGVHAADYILDDRLLANKYMSMDYCDVDNARIRELYSQIKQERNWAGWGELRIHEQFEEFLTAFVRTVGAVVLSVTLFTATVPEKSGLSVLNHPLFVLLFLVLMLLLTFLAPVCNNKADAYWANYNEEATLGNRLFGFLGFIGFQEKERALDIRSYEQDGFFEIKMKEAKEFTEESSIGKWARGPMGGYKALAAGISRLLTGMIYLFVCLKAWGGAFGIGAVTQYLSAFVALSDGIYTMVKVLGDMRSNTPYLKKVFSYLDTPNKMYQGTLSVEKRSDRNYDVEFKNVSFRYPGTQEWALKNVSLKFRIGERLAVVGQNGSGKTTMIKLLCRLYDPDEGEILLNGINIRKYQYKEYMELFSVVFQDFVLTAFSLGENVAGCTGYDAKRVRSCLADVGFSERLEQMKNGLDTCIYKEFDKEGVEVSGGEAQKIAIARALYRNSPFIILDEPTAALDPMAEMEVYESFDRLIQDKTAVYISHRLSSCRFCDRIVVFDHGRLIQSGTHEELAADREGKYYELWQAQAQYYA